MSTKTMYKYELMIVDDQEIVVPVGAIPRAVGVQGEALLNRPYLWCEVDTRKEAKSKLTVFICGTGIPIPTKAKKYIGTFQLKMRSGTFVGHVYTS